MTENPEEKRPLILALDPFPGLLAPIYEALDEVGEVRIITELNRALPQTVQAAPAVVFLPYRSTAPGAFRFNGPLFEKMAIGLNPELEGRFVFFLTEEDPRADAQRLVRFTVGGEAHAPESARRHAESVIAERGRVPTADST